MEGNIEDMNDEALEEQLRVLVEATKRKEKLVQEVRERMRRLEELQMEEVRLILKIGKIVHELEVSSDERRVCVRVVKEGCKFDLVAVGTSEFGW